MRVSGFTIVKNGVKLGYPMVESIRSILPLCDEFIVSVGKSEDNTLDVIRSIKDPKIRIIETIWNQSQGCTVLSEETNIALKECTGDWAFYLQTDEVVHENDLPRLKRCMQESCDDPQVDALRFKWFHFYGSHFRYRIDHGWYQKQDRIIRNNGSMISIGDAWGFGRKDMRPMKRKNTECLLYHYGWVQPPQVMALRRLNAERIGFVDLKEEEGKKDFDFGQLHRFPPYFGTHPSVMNQIVKDHAQSQADLQNIQNKYWWHPAQWFKLRHKTGKRVKQRI